MSEDLLALFRKTGALLDGHFVLRSGLHSREYFQCALLLEHTGIAAKVCGWLADKVRQFGEIEQGDRCSSGERTPSACCFRRPAENLSA